MLRRFLGLVLAWVLLVVTAGLAHAEPVGRISSIEVDEGSISLTFAGVDLPEGASVDPDSVVVTLDGTQVDTAAQPLTAAEEIPTRTVVLAVDTSGSMGDDGKMAAAIEAGSAFVESVPDDVLVGLVSFSAKPRIRVEPTADRPTVLTALARLAPRGDTALFDGILVAADATGDQGVRSVIALTDGADTTSVATLGSTVETVTENGVQVDAVALGETGDDTVSALTQITSPTGGSVVEADGAAQLADFFAVAAESRVNELLVTASVPSDFAATSATVEVSGTAGDIEVGDSAFITVVPGAGAQTRAAPASQFGPTPVEPATPLLPSWLSPAALWIGLGALLVGAAAILALAFVRPRDPRDESVKGRLSIYTLTGGTPQMESQEITTALGTSSVARSAVELADRVVGGREYDETLSLRLDAAGLPFRPAEWVLIQGAAGIVTGSLMFLLSGFNPWAAVLGFVLGLFVPSAYLRHKASSRRGLFIDQLPDALQLMASSLQAGYSLPQAVDTVTREGLDPLSNEFRRALAESRLGVPIEDAMENIADRMQSEDFRWVVMAIRIQRQVGGSLGEVLTTVADTLREREQLRRTVRALSADGRLSAWIIGIAPFAVAGFLFLFQNDYISPLFGRGLVGWALVGTALLSIGIGVFFVSRIVRVEI